MSKQKSAVPAIVLPRNASASERVQTDALQKLAGQKGDGWDKALTKRDFADLAGFNVRFIGKGLRLDFEPGGDFLIPPKPLGVEILPTFNTVFLRWDFPDPDNEWYSVTEIWRIKVLLEEDGSPYVLDGETHVIPGFAMATRVMAVHGQMATDHVNPDESYVYWIRHVNRGGVAGAVHETVGTLATTFALPIDVLYEYSQDIYNSDAYQWLRADLGVLDGVNRSLVGAGFGGDSGLGELLGNANSLTELLAEQALADSLAKHTQQFEIKAQISRNYAMYSGGIHAAVNASEAYVNRIGVLESKWENELGNSIDSKIDEYHLALTGENGAIATAFNNFTVQFDGNTAGLEELSQAVASNKQLHTRWGVKSDVNGKKSGVVFDNDGHMSQFLVDADVFAITNGNEEIVPFVVRDNKTVIKEAMIDHAAIYTLIASRVTAERIAASIAIESPQITGGNITGTTFNNGNGTFKVTSQGKLTAVGAEFQSIIIRDKNGGVVMSADGISQTYIKDLLAGQIIAAKIYAQDIQGDVLDALVKDTAELSLNGSYSGNVNPKGQIASFSVSPLPFARTVSFGGGLTARTTVGYMDDGGDLLLRLLRNGREVNTVSVSYEAAWIVAQDQKHLQDLVFPILTDELPKDVAANYVVEMQINGDGKVTHWSQGATIQAFKRGSTLS